MPLIPSLRLEAKMKFEIGDRVKINEVGRKEYYCRDGGNNPLNFTGTVALVRSYSTCDPMCVVEWDNGGSETYASRTLTRIGGST